MILSVSRRTDIPALYGDWFMDKIASGTCDVKNPFNGRVETVPLGVEHIDAIVFWSRNYAPMRRALMQLTKKDYRFYCHLTIIGYPRIIDPGSPLPEKSAATAKKIARQFGPRSLVWRYDPIVLTSITDADWHIVNFSRIAAMMAGITDEVIVSFIDYYRKMDRKFYSLLKNNGIRVDRPSSEALVHLVGRLKHIALNHGITMKLCCEPDFLKTTHLSQASCIDPARIVDIAGTDVTRLKKSPTRKGCGCVYAKDIGLYNTCTLGCAYCYATSQKPAMTMGAS